MHGSLNQVLEFLCKLFNDGLSYNSINVNRSMLLSTIFEQDGVKVGQHHLVSQLMKGIYNSNPPAPRYSSFWDVNQVFIYLECLGGNEALSFELLSKKMLMLLALTTLFRVSELASVSASSVRIAEDGARFVLSKPRKNQRHGPLWEKFLRRLPEAELTCPVSCLELYLDKTKPCRPLSFIRWSEMLSG